MIEMSLEEQSRRLVQRERELGLSGPVSVALNPGTHRSPQKRALLRELRRVGSPFHANIGDEIVPSASQIA